MKVDRKKHLEMVQGATSVVSESMFPPIAELLTMLKQSRDQLVMCTLIDKSGQCKELVDRIDKRMGWK